MVFGQHLCVCNCPVAPFLLFEKKRGWTPGKRHKMDDAHSFGAPTGTGGLYGRGMDSGPQALRNVCVDPAWVLFGTIGLFLRVLLCAGRPFVLGNASKMEV